MSGRLPVIIGLRMRSLLLVRGWHTMLLSGQTVSESKQSRMLFMHNDIWTYNGTLHFTINAPVPSDLENPAIRWRTHAGQLHLHLARDGRLSLEYTRQRTNAS